MEKVIIIKQTTRKPYWYLIYLFVVKGVANKGIICWGGDFRCEEGGSLEDLWHVITEMIEIKNQLYL